MATPGCDRANLLYEFRDNDTQNITAASMRLFVNCVYDNFQDKTDIIDNVQTYETQNTLSANQGAILNDKINSLDNLITDLDQTKADITDVYTKVEINNNFYTKNYIDNSFYTTSETYNKSEVDSLFASVEQSLIALNNRITNIVQKNNLIE
jgi:hypothetical protein